MRTALSEAYELCELQYILHHRNIRFGNKFSTGEENDFASLYGRECLIINGA